MTTKNIERPKLFFLVFVCVSAILRKKINNKPSPSIESGLEHIWQALPSNKRQIEHFNTYTTNRPEKSCRKRNRPNRILASCYFRFVLINANCVWCFAIWKVHTLKSHFEHIHTTHTQHTFCVCFVWQSTHNFSKVNLFWRSEKKKHPNQ